MSNPAAHFVGLTVEKLWSVEEELGEPDHVQEYVEDLLKILAEWRDRLTVHPPYQRERAAYEKAVATLREVWLHWNFRYDCNPWLPESFDLPAKTRGEADR